MLYASPDFSARSKAILLNIDVADFPIPPVVEKTAGTTGIFYGITLREIPTFLYNKKIIIIIMVYTNLYYDVIA